MVLSANVTLLPALLFCDVHRAILASGHADAAGVVRVAIPRVVAAGATRAADTCDRPIDALDWAVHLSLRHPVNQANTAQGSGHAPGGVLLRVFETAAALGDMAVTSPGSSDQSAAVARVQPMRRACSAIDGAAKVLATRLAAVPKLRCDGSAKVRLCVADAFSDELEADIRATIDEALNAPNGRRAIVEVDLSRCAGLCGIKHEFCNWCAVDAVALPSSFRYIGSHFLVATAMRELDLTGLAQLTAIGEHFVAGCGSLARIVLPASVTRIGQKFGASAHIQDVDLSRCVALTRIPDHFLYQAHVGTLRWPPSVTVIGDSVLGDCTVHAVDLSPLTELTTVGSEFAMYAQISETRAAFPASLTCVGDDFCSAATIHRLDVAGCTRLTQVGDGFASRIEFFDSITLPASLTTVGDSFMFATIGADVDLSQCNNLAQIGWSFLNQACLDGVVTMPPGLVQLKGWACAEAAITHVDFSQCDQLSAFGPDFGHRTEFGRITLPRHLVNTAIGQYVKSVCDNVTLHSD